MYSCIKEIFFLYSNLLSCQNISYAVIFDQRADVNILQFNRNFESLPCFTLSYILRTIFRYKWPRLLNQARASGQIGIRLSRICYGTVGMNFLTLIFLPSDRNRFFILEGKYSSCGYLKRQGYCHPSTNCQ